MQGRIADLIRGLCWLDTATRVSGQAHANRCLISITSINGQPTLAQSYLRQIYEGYFGHTGNEAVHDLTEQMVVLGITGINSAVLLIERTAAWAEARIEEGTHLFLPTHGNFVPIAVRVIGLEHDTDPCEALVNMNATSDTSGTDCPSDIGQEHNAQRLGPVIRVYNQLNTSRGVLFEIIDCRTGLVFKDDWNAGTHLSILIHSQLPVPQALLE